MKTKIHNPIVTKLNPNSNETKSVFCVVLLKNGTRIKSSDPIGRPTSVMAASRDRKLCSNCGEYVT